MRERCSGSRFPLSMCDFKKEINGSEVSSEGCSGGALQFLQPSAQGGPWLPLSKTRVSSLTVLLTPGIFQDVFIPWEERKEGAKDVIWCGSSWEWHSHFCLLFLWKSLHVGTLSGRPIKMSIKVNTLKEVMARHYAMREGKKVSICIMLIKLTWLLQIILFHLEL